MIEGNVKTYKFIFKLGRQYMYAEMKYDNRTLVEKSFAAIDDEDAERFVNTGEI